MQYNGSLHDKEESKDLSSSSSWSQKQRHKLIDQNKMHRTSFDSSSPLTSSPASISSSLSSSPASLWSSSSSFLSTSGSKSNDDDQANCKIFKQSADLSNAASFLLRFNQSNHNNNKVRFSTILYYQYTKKNNNNNNNNKSLIEKKRK